MINRRRLLLGGTAITAAAAASAPVILHELAKRRPANLPVSQEVVAWLRANAIPLATTEPGSGFHDLEFLRAAIGNARIVSLGEATHGTREFFQLKHRLIEFCVAELGFNVIAFEDNYGSTLAVNHYVLEGTGNAAEAVARGFDVRFWHTEEVIALVEWVRRWNMAHDRKVKFYGFDMQWGTPAALRLLDYLRRVATDVAAASEAPLAPVVRNEWSARTSLEQGTILAQIKAILAAFDAERALWVGRSSELEWHLARLSAVAVDQYVRLSWEPYHQGFTWRDRCMADNVRALLEAEGPHAKALLWAHNAHVRRTPHRPGLHTMGGFLHAEWGPQHVVIGFGFNQGGFRAVGGTPGRIEDHIVGPAPAGFVDAALAGAGFSLLALDLRRVPSHGPVAAWMASRPLQRSVTAVLRPETRWYHPLYWSELFYYFGLYEDADDPRDNYDLLLFVESTTPTRSSARASRCIFTGILSSEGHQAQHPAWTTAIDAVLLGPAKPHLLRRWLKGARRALRKGLT
jgi:erythromycin esterase